MKIKSLGVSVITLLALIACSEKPSEKMLKKEPDYIKASAVRPTSIPSKLDSSDACSIDTVNDKARGLTSSITDKEKVKFSGWIGNTITGTTPKDVIIELEGSSKIYLSASRGLKRPDVAAHFNRPSLVDSGWNSYSDLKDVASGSYTLRVIQIEGDAGLICAPNSTIVIN